MVTVLLAVLLAGPGARADFRSAGAVFAAIPANLRPPNGGAWDKAHTYRANVWLRDNAAKRTVVVKFVFVHATVSNARGRGSNAVARVSGTWEADTPPANAESFDLPLGVTFAKPADVERMKSAKRGDTFTCAGVIREASVGTYPRVPGKVKFDLVVDEGVLGP